MNYFKNNGFTFFIDKKSKEYSLLGKLKEKLKENRMTASERLRKEEPEAYTNALCMYIAASYYNQRETLPAAFFKAYVEHLRAQYAEEGVN